MRKRADRGQAWQAYEQSMAFCRLVGLSHVTEGSESYYEHELTARKSVTPRKVEEGWKGTFCTIAACLGFNRATRRILWEELALGNWEHLHVTNEERFRTADEWLDMLYYDVFYCSDRWTLDRLTRCHWTYRQYKWAAEHPETILGDDFRGE